jgi:cold shock CspA family protein
MRFFDEEFAIERLKKRFGDGYKTLAQGQDVEFEVTTGPKGPQAENVLRV